MYDVFISYRRDGGHEMARLLYEHLKIRGLNCFFDLEELGSGQFNIKLLKNIEESNNFVLILSRDSLERCKNTDDWVRMEIEYAIEKNKNIVPFMMDGFEWPKDLPESIAALPYYNGVQLVREYFDASINKLIEMLITDKSVIGAKKSGTGVPNEASAPTTVAPLLKRVFIFLEDSRWSEADEYCEKVLDIDPECAEAYLGKLLAELKVSTKADLELLSNTFDHTYNYKKVIRFGDQNLVDELKQYNLTIREREEEKRKDAIYNIAAGLAMYQTPQDQSKAAEEFAEIPGYRDADKRAKNCHRQALLLAYDLALKEAQKATTATEYAVISKKFRAIASDYPPAKEKAEEYSEKSKELAETERKDVIYAGAILAMGTDDISSIERAIEDFESISGWKDSDEQIFLCHAKIEELKAQEAEKRLKEVRLEKKTSLVFKVVSIVAVVVCAILIFAAIWNNVIVPNKYNKAIELMNQGKYTEAIAEFEKLNGYKSSENKIEICKNEIPYNKAIELMDAGKYTEAISEFEKLDAYGNSEQKIEECRRAIKYNDAISKMNSGNIIEAYEALIALDYKDSTEKAASIYYEYTVEKLKLAKAGDYVFFGSYEQDNNLSDGKEEIEWLVLEVKDGRALMISKYALAYKQYNTNEVYVAWENSSLREWLNDYFINNAFSADEKSIISEASTFANESFCYDTKLGTTTRDRVFLLSMTEIYKYFDSYSERECSLTTYALEQGAAEVDWYGNCQWWLRIPGSKDEPVYIDMDGTVSSVDNDITLYRAVRPALWVDLNS